MRGGARKGTGPKQTVPDELLRRRAGRYCERRWQKIINQTVEERIDKQTKAEREIWASLQAIPVSQRRSAIAAGTVEEKAEDLVAIITNKARRAARAASQPPPKRGSRVLTVKKTRPWKAKAALLARGVAWFAAYTRWKTGTPVVPVALPVAPLLG